VIACPQICGLPTKDITIAMPKNSLPIVAYGSQRGSSERIAKEIARSLGVTALPLNRLRLEALSAASTAIFVVSTFGNGQFPTNANSFSQDLLGNCYDLTGLNFAVLGLGSTYYPHFCQAGATVFGELARAGAKPMLPLVRSDRVSHDAGRSVSDRFVRDVLALLAKEKAQTSLQFHVIPSEQITHAPKNFSIVAIQGRILLSAPGYFPGLRRYVLPLPSDVSYVAGDQISLLPENDPHIVESAIGKLNLDATTTFSVDDPLDSFAIPPKVTLHELFVQYIDLSCVVPPKLSHFAGVDRPQSASVGQFLLSEFSRPIDDLPQFLAALPLIEPRTYSLASETPDTAELVVGDKALPDGRPGLATGFLARESTTSVAIRVVAGEFRYPEEEDTPLILVALGTGIAPVLSLLEHRRKGQFGKCIVMYGLRCRESAEALLPQLQAYKDAGVVDELWLVVSRAEEKLHVPDVIQRNAEKVWELWSNTETELLYCGPIGGYEAVSAALTALAVHFGKPRGTDAAMFTAMHKITVEAF
jgi:sulfite reductase (NADPH) flavoprotein alpha-component